jgi:hypothetical protein
MSLLKFIFSKTFLIQIGLAIVALVVLAVLTMQWLEHSTNQDERIKVPDLAKQSLGRTEITLDKLDLRYEILDSANFNPDYPSYSVIDQVPQPGKFVKENRKIYITLNPSGYGKVIIPDLIRKTRRQAEPTLRSLGFEIGSVTYKPDIAIDAVLEMRHKGKLVEAGDELVKTAKIDLILGDGSGLYSGDLNENDSIEGNEADNENENNDEF